MKKNIFLLVLIIVLGLFGCEKDKTIIKVLVPDGTPSIATGKLFNDETLDFTVVAGSDLLTTALTQKEYDIVIAPLTAGAKLYLGNGTSYKVDSIITFGNSYIISRKETKLESINDLQDKTIVAYGKNNTPDIILRAALEKNNVQSTIEYEASVNDVLSNRFVGATKADYILVAEPVLSKIQLDLKIEVNIIDLQEALKTEIESVPQAAIFVLNSNEKTKSAINKIKANIEELNADPEGYAKDLMKINSDKYPSFSKLKETIIAHSIPNSNLNFKNAKENKEMINKYFELINKYNSKILNNEVPDEGFYN